jgi:CheY-like chemotaxis protein
MVGIENETPDLKMVIPRRILIVDDYTDLAEGLAKWLRSLGNDAKAAFDGIKGIKAAETFRPHIILLDIDMPKLNGYEVAERIRQQPWGKRMMLVALTGHRTQEDRERIRKGFNAYLVKPLIYKQVAALLASYSPSSHAFVPPAFV